MVVWLISQTVLPILSSSVASAVTVNADLKVPEPLAASLLSKTEDEALELTSGIYSTPGVYFEPNYGQTDSQARFLSRGDGFALFLTSTEAVLSLTQQSGGNSSLAGPERRKLFREQMRPNGAFSRLNADHKPMDRKTAAVRMKMVGANPDSLIEGVGLLPGISNYFIGNDPEKWRTNIPHYARVQYHEVYPGVDLVYRGDGCGLEFDFILAPGVAAGTIKLAFEGAQEIRVDDQGDLVLNTEAGDVRQHKPAVYQEIDGIKQEVAGRFVVNNESEVGFELGDYDMTRSLVIDPILSYSTYFGAGGFDGAIAVDSSGSAYITGNAFLISDSDAFVTKLNGTGTDLVYTTYFGGRTFDVGIGIAVDSIGNAYVTGETNSRELPTTPGAFQTAYGGGDRDAFVAKLNGTGTALVYSTYLGGSDFDGGSGIAVDSLGNVYVTGDTRSVDFRTTSEALQRGFGGVQDPFVTKLNGTGTALVYSTYLGGKHFDIAGGIAVDSSGNAYVMGDTFDRDLPITPGAFQTTYGGGRDAFVTVLNETGTALVYSTYIGGGGSELSEGIAVDSSGHASVIVQTDSTDLVTTPGAFQRSLNGISDIFVARLNATGAAIYSTYLGGSGLEDGGGIAADSSGNVYVTGRTDSTDFPTRNPFQVANGGAFFEDAFVAELNAAGTGLIFATYIGGRGTDFGTDIAVDPLGSIYALGRTGSPDFPTTPGAFQVVRRGFDSFIVKIELSQEPKGFGIASASVTGRKLFVFGEGFDAGAVILLDGEQQETTRNKQDPTSLVAKKSGKKIGQGQTVMIQVRNSDGRLTSSFRFTRPNQIF